MAYARLDDRCLSHPKILALSDTAFRLWAMGLVYCNAHLTDGFIPATAPLTFAIRGNTQRAIAELCEPWRDGAEPLWHRAEGGYQVHDFVARNMSRADVIAEQSRKRANKEAWKKRAGAAAGTGAEPVPAPQGTAREPGENHGPSPSPSPSVLPSPSETGAPPAAASPARKPRELKHPTAKLLERYGELLAKNLSIDKPEFNFEKAGSIFKRLVEAHGEEVVRGALERFMASRREFEVEARWTIGVFSSQFNRYRTDAQPPAPEAPRRQRSAAATGVTDDWSEFS